MMRAVTTFLLLVFVAEAQLPSRQIGHHDSLIGVRQRIPDLFIKGHVRDNFVIKPQTQHHDALTGHVSSIPDPFVKGHVRDNFVLKPQTQHHDALTGHVSSIPEPFIKGHISDAPPSFLDYSLKKPMVADIPSMIQESAFYKVSGDQCSQYTLKRQWTLYATTIGGFKVGTCWEHGYNVNEGSKEIRMPLIGKANVRFFKEPKKETPRTEVFTQTSPDGISAIAQWSYLCSGISALISLVGISGAIFAMLRVRRGTFMTGKESLLA